MNHHNTAIFGVSGWKNSGKTTLVEALVSEFTRRGLSVNTVKHAHHAFNLDHEGTDSWRHQNAGAREVALISSQRWALMHENAAGDTEPDLDTMVAKMTPCDLILAEGFKASPINKIETIRQSSLKRTPLWQTHEGVVAVASDTVLADCSKPQFSLNAISEIADFISQIEGLNP